MTDEKHLARGATRGDVEASRTAATIEPYPWADADRISDVIVDVVNAELARMRAAGTMNPEQLLAGVFLGCMALFQTMPAKKPPSLQLAMEAIEECLRSLISSRI
jgi:hypothetical protein